MKFEFDSKYIKIGIMSFSVVALSILFFFAVYRMDGLIKALGVFTGIVTPFIYGLVMAYLLCPVYNRTYDMAIHWKWPVFKERDRSVIYSKWVATIVALACMIGIVTILLWMIIPGMIESIVSLAKTLPKDVSNLLYVMQSKLDDLPQVAGPLEKWANTAVDSFVEFVQATLVPKYQAVITGVSEGIFGFAKVVMNLCIGVIICVFFLNSKEVFAAQTKKLIFASLSEEKAKSFLFGSTFINKTFGGFINGKLIDSLIIGIICFVVMSIFQWPYIMLISVIIGVTNIIPFFGPFIGAIPSALLIVIEDPLTCVYFLIFILILQQVDGNIIGPKILGGTTGLPSFWVMFAILVGGGLFGFVGMILGIPIFACIYAYTCFAVNKRLTKKGYTNNLEVYKDLHIETIRDKNQDGVKLNEGNN
ncbi:MAG: AI-2E family transporter [Anaerovoracaceae bacterium]